MGPGSPNRKGHIRGTCTWHLLALNTLILCSCWINQLQVAGAYTVVMWDVATITVELVLICRHLHQYNQLVQKLFYGTYCSVLLLFHQTSLPELLCVRVGFWIYGPSFVSACQLPYLSSNQQPQNTNLQRICKFKK